MTQVTLGAEALEALAAETRIRLLKGLVDRQQTLAQLARFVERDKAVVHRHLQNLLRGGLVERDDSHSFTYYRLTWQGRGVVAPTENSRIALLLGLGVSGSVVAAWAAAVYFQQSETLMTAGVTSFSAHSGLLLSGIFAGVLAAAIIFTLALRRLRPRRAAREASPWSGPA